MDDKSSEFNADYVKDWMETYTGRKVRVSDPRLEDVNIIDVAHSLAMQCRYNGHTQFFYSVGHHCNILFDWCRQNAMPPATCLKALLHDSGEAWASDVPRPLKPMVPDLVAAERKMTGLVYRMVGLVEGDEDDEVVHSIDHRIIRDERASVMSDSGNRWSTDELPSLGVGEIRPLPIDEVKIGFLARYASAAEAHLGRPVYMSPFWGNRCSWTDSPGARISDVVECDALGGVALVLERGVSGMFQRDRGAGFPRPKTRWLHGRFTLTQGGDGS